MGSNSRLSILIQSGLNEKKIIKVLLKITSVIVCFIAVFFIVIFTRQYIIDKRINDDISRVYSDEKYISPVEVNGVELVKQEISCGFATIEMFSNWLGKTITEEHLYDINNKVITTAMGKGFCNEMNKQFPEFTTTRLSNLTNTQLIDLVYDRLKQGMPVPIEFAALYNTTNGVVWTLHYGLVTGMDIGKDLITVYNPYGYVETYTINEFLKATRFDSYENMEYYFKIAFALGIFDKNTIYIVE